MTLYQKMGEMILLKDTILYHTSDQIYKKNKTKPMLFCTFHPSEWEGVDNEFVSFIKLKRDIRLLFMIDDFKGRRIFSSLNKLANKPQISNLQKQNYSFLFSIIPKLKEEKFDGWFSTIENKAFTEVALLNQNDIFEVVKTEILNKKWRNSNNFNNNIILKNWGTHYPIYTNVILNLPKSYQNKIENYLYNSEHSKTPNDYVFEIILKNSVINYF